MEDCNLARTLSDIRVKLVKEGKESKANPILYKQMVGSLRYLCNTRPNITYGIGSLVNLWKTLNKPICWQSK